MDTQTHPSGARVTAPCPECALTFAVPSDGTIPRHFLPFKQYVEYCSGSGTPIAGASILAIRPEKPLFKPAAAETRGILRQPAEVIAARDSGPVNPPSLKSRAPQLPSIRVRSDGKVRCPGCRELLSVDAAVPFLPLHNPASKKECSWGGREFAPQIPPEATSRANVPRKIPSKFKRDAERLAGLTDEQRKRVARNVKRHSLRSEEEVKYAHEQERRHKAESSLSKEERDKRDARKQLWEENRRRERKEHYMCETRRSSDPKFEGGVSVRTYNGRLPGLGKRQ